MAGLKKNLPKAWKALRKHLELDDAIPLSSNVYLGCDQKDVKVPEKNLQEKFKYFNSLFNSQELPKEDRPDLSEAANITAAQTQFCNPAIFSEACLAQERHKSYPSKTPKFKPKDTKSYKYDMRGHVVGCVERYAELSGKSVESLKKVSTPCIDDSMLDLTDFEVKGELSKVCSQIVLKCLYVARIARCDLLWAVNTLAREVTKWTVACDKRLHRLISYMHWTKDQVQICTVGDNFQECCIACFCDASFAGDIKGSYSTSGMFLAIIGPNTFVPLLWFVKKQGAVSHSSTEAEIIALDAALRMEALPALLLWENILDTFEEHHITSAKVLRTEYNPFINIDYVPCNLPKSSGLGLLFCFEDNDAVIKMTIRGRSQSMRHVARTHRVDLDWILERIRTDPGVQMRYIGTKAQIADLLTKGSFSAIQWDVLVHLAGLVPQNILTE